MHSTRPSHKSNGPSRSIRSFAPVADDSARILILGTVPGIASLRAGQYYGHPRNAFWRIVAELFHFDVELPYDDRIRRLVANKIAVWDVIRACRRESSLDSDIDSDSIVPNNLSLFLRRHPDIRRVCFNGANAARLFRMHVQSRLTSKTTALEYIPLPSTSPANAGMTYADKRKAWSRALRI